MNISPELFWRRFLPTPGALSAAEACAISDLAAQVPKGVYADLGSHHGKSSMAAAHSLPTGTLYMVDQVYCDDPNVWEHSVQKTPENNPWSYTKTNDFKERVIENIRIVSAMEISACLVGDYSENFSVYLFAYSIWYVSIIQLNPRASEVICQVRVCVERPCLN